MNTGTLGRVVVGFSLFLGLALTASAALFGFRVLDLVTGCTGHYPSFLGERHKLQAVAVATQEFALDRGRCPTSTAELVDGRYLSAFGARSAYGGPIVLACWKTSAETLVQVRSPGPDHAFDTADDLLSDSERADGP